jgi:hypothetical protein
MKEQMWEHNLLSGTLLDTEVTMCTDESDYIMQIHCEQDALYESLHIKYAFSDIKLKHFNIHWQR